MSEQVIEDTEVKQKILYSFNTAAERLNIGYNRIIYSVGKGYLVPFQKEPVYLIEEEELFRWARERKIEIPEQ